MRPSVLATVALACLTIAACTGAATPSGSASASPSANSPLPGGDGSAGISHPTGATDLVLRIDTGGGFIAPSAQVGRIPELSVLGDGRVLVPGAQIEIYPPPAMPSLVTFRISQDGLQNLLGNARSAGLLGPDAHYDAVGIADAPTTTFTVVAEGGTHVISAYALSMDPAGDSQLDPAVRAARAALRAFQQRAEDMRSWLGGEIVEPEGTYLPSAMRIFAMPAQPEAQGGVQHTLVDWPLPTPLAAFGAPYEGTEMRCGVISGPELATLLPKLQTANQLTFWRSGSSVYQLILRPLLPDESGCPTGS